MDMVRPVVPPLYPEYVEGVAVDSVDRDHATLVTDFVHFNEYLKSNYSVEYLQRVPTAFEAHKYTDTYEDPFRVETRLQYYLEKRFVPKELYTKTSKYVRKKLVKEVDTKEILEKYTVKEEKRESESEDESDEEERKRKLVQTDPTLAENLELAKAAKAALDPELGDADEDDEDEVDEELDEGNDYMNDYFDNGEDYLSEDDALEEGDVF